ncbi:prolipoprotein diacylglyceryl transferase [Streptosporangium sp. NBC_01495]|uniref:prolipoprotein diacylglyceryl transferase n=1 Tax=Streptosporangium sp. NBC_01495 TaxID=2903899 RepID=UPI002E2FC9D5|nr:prolipoprotein diacylglyceryl transferase [Streptosporangium sp. NBC_01495]
MPLASIPSPSQGVWHLFGVVPIRAYALCIVLGVVVAVAIGERRWRARGGAPGTIVDLAVWAVPFGLVGGRLYHVITDWQLYFGPDAPNEPIEALFIWNGGLGIWGAVALGGVGVWLGCRGRGISLTAVADTVAPGIAVAQAIGRWGNYFNQELFGSPTDLPWGLEIDPDRPGTVPGEDTYHPAFLYESIWDLGLALVLIWIGRKYLLRHGRLFALYVAGYTVGRFWIEGLRVDTAHHILGLRLNQWTSIILFIGAMAYFWFTRNKTGEERVSPVPDPADLEDGATAPDEEADSDSAKGGAATLAAAAPGDGAGDPVDPAHPSDQADQTENDGEAGQDDGARPASATLAAEGPVEAGGPVDPSDQAESVESDRAEDEPDRTVPAAASDKVASDKAAPIKAEPGKVASDKAVPGGTASESTTSDRAVPDDAADSDGTASGAEGGDLPEEVATKVVPEGEKERR